MYDSILAAYIPLNSFFLSEFVKPLTLFLLYSVMSAIVLHGCFAREPSVEVE